MKRTLKPLLKDVVVRAATSTSWGSSASNADSLNIATFHRVLPAERIARYVLPGIAVTPDEFAWYLEYFTAHYTCGPLEHVAALFEQGVRPSRPLLALTFDDGQVDNFEYALPLLDDYGVKASFFVPTAAIENREPLWPDLLGHAAWRAAESQPEQAFALMGEWGVSNKEPRVAARELIARAKDLSVTERELLVQRVIAITGESGVPSWDGFMNWEQLKTLVSEGHEVGSHSHTHPILPNCTDDELQREVNLSRELIEQNVGVKPGTFCYPNGDNNARVRRAVSDAGYQRGVTTRWGTNASLEKPFGLARMDMVASHCKDRRGELSTARLAFRMSGLHRGVRRARAVAASR